MQLYCVAAAATLCMLLAKATPSLEYPAPCKGCVPVRASLPGRVLHTYGHVTHVPVPGLLAGGRRWQTLTTSISIPLYCAVLSQAVGSNKHVWVRIGISLYICQAQLSLHLSVSPGILQWLEWLQMLPHPNNHQDQQRCVGGVSVPSRVLGTCR